MRKRHLYNFYNLANALVFNNMLPNVKLAIRLKPSDYFGYCEVGCFRGQKPSQFKITINYNSLVEYDVFNDDEIKRTLLHEMVHLWIAILAGRNFWITSNIFEEHDRAIFNSIGEIAFNLNLIKHGDLLA